MPMISRGSPSAPAHNIMLEDSLMWSDVINSPPPPSPLPSSLSRWRHPADPQPVVKAEELTSSPDFRNLRSPVLPRQPNTSTPTKAAIQAHTYTSTTQQGQDVPPVVNSAVTYPTSTAIRTDVFAHHHSRFETPSSTNVLNQHLPRPRTSNQVFTSSHDLVAHYGLPQSLPPAPSTIPRRTTQPDTAPSLFNFSSLRSSYLNMLAQKPTDNAMPAENTQSSPSTVSPADLCSPSVHEQRLQELVDMIQQDSSPISPDLNTPELTTSPDFEFGGENFLSSPYYTTPFESPYEDFLTTPVIMDSGDMEMYTDSADPSYSLFPEYLADFEKPVVPSPPVPPPTQDLYTMSPVSPDLHDFNSPSESINPASIYPIKSLPAPFAAYPLPASSSPSSAKASGSSSIAPSRRKTSATGTRKGVTPEALVPIDAPTQPRKYVTPSATSRKEVPSVFARRRAARGQSVFGDGGENEDQLLEELQPLRPGATELEQIEYKRRQNTVAARRSRMRKLEHQRKLEDDADMFRRQRDVWRERARMLQGLMEARGLPCPQFPIDEDEA